MGFSPALQAMVIVVGVISTVLGLALWQWREWLGIAGTGLGIVLLIFANLMFHYNRIWKPSEEAQEYRDFMGSFGVRRSGRKRS